MVLLFLFHANEVVFLFILFLIVQTTMQTTLLIANLLTSLQFARVRVLLDAAMTTLMIQAAAV